MHVWMQVREIRWQNTLSKHINLTRNISTSMAWKPSSWQTNFAEVVFPIPGVPLNKTAFFKPESFCFFPCFLLPVSKKCSFQAFNQLRSCKTCTPLHLRKWKLIILIQVYIKTKYNHQNMIMKTSDYTSDWFPMISFGSLGRYFSVHIKEDWTVVAVFGLAWLEGEREDRGTAFVDKGMQLRT